MSWCWSRKALAATLLAVAGLATPSRAQGRREWDVRALGIASKPEFIGAGVGYAWRDSRRTRIEGALAAGNLVQAGLAGRAEVVWHFLLDPAKRRGSAVYGGGGLSAQVGQGRVRPFVLLVIGAENAPGGAGGSYVEVGVGGGVRATVGYRWRKQRAPGR